MSVAASVYDAGPGGVKSEGGSSKARLLLDEKGAAAGMNLRAGSTE